jgi:tetratricopeptide (TPR) repeat protein
MKRTILILAGLAAVSGLAIHFMAKSPKQAATPGVSAGAETAAVPETPKSPPHQPAQRPARPATAVSNQSSASPAPTSTEAIAFTSAVDEMVSPHSTYLQRREALQRLQDSGRLADAAAELERLKTSDPQNAMYPTALGEAYLRMCATSTDVRSQAIWAMSADQNFETALNLDPSNWDARFTKAVAMSYWPDNLNKSGEVIQNFNTLIQQQEQETPQPQFEQAYEWLGKEYQKVGQPDAAQQVWQRGLALYPGNQSLQALLAPPATAQQ